MDLKAVRTFVTVADTGQFQEAAVELSLTQQAVSKRIAAFERDLGVQLFTRTARGVVLTIDGQAFLPHARELLKVAERAAAAVRPGRRALRVDVIGRQLAPAMLLRDFHQAHQETALDVVTLYDADTAITAVETGAVDATFRAVTRTLPENIRAVRVLDEPLQLLTGPTHALAAADSVTPSSLANQRIWIPAIRSGTEWSTYYEDLATTFALTLDTVGPDFGIEPLLDAIADSPTLTTLVGEQTRLIWPAGYDLRRIPIHSPTPAYPHSLLYRKDNPHPALKTLRKYLDSPSPNTKMWTPKWAQPTRTNKR